jgi:hypothetical protein
MSRIHPGRGKASEKENAWISENPLMVYRDEASN